MKKLKSADTKFFSLLQGTFLALLVGCFCTGSANAVDTESEAEQASKLLDYVAVDYAGAVHNGKVIQQGEYAEMQEFAALVRTKLASLPARAEQSKLVASAERLSKQIAQRDDPAAVAITAHALATQLIVFYNIQASPRQPPDVAAAAMLYETHCASCHGKLGAGDGPAATGMAPPPIAFTDSQRAARRSPFALYQVITQGLSGTAMTSFARLPEEQRWALAFYVGGLAYSEGARSLGESLWRDNASVRTTITSLKALSQSSEADVAQLIGATQAHAITAYLRAHPSAVTKQTSSNDGSVVIARQRLASTLTAYRDGDLKEAKALALAAYLDGVEPVEPTLASRNRDLLRQIEEAMAQLRSQIDKHSPIETIEAQAAKITRIFDRIDTVLRAKSSNGTAAFLGSFTILLREGLEALLIVIGMIAFLRKAERLEVLRYVHAAWVSALLAGAVTWALATYLVGISGANREVTEGLSSLFAAIVLLSVGIWMHQKSLAGRWQHYLEDKMSAALTRRSALFLFLLAFVAVYREVFETILFYAAMWNDQDGKAILGGLLTGSAALALTAFLLLRFSMRLPIGKFFSISSMLIAVLAVVLVGKGVAALQEAGWVSQEFVHGPRVDWLGIYPTLQSLVSQLGIGLAAVIGFVVNSRSGPAKAR